MGLFVIAMATVTLTWLSDWVPLQSCMEVLSPDVRPRGSRATEKDRYRGLGFETPVWPELLMRSPLGLRFKPAEDEGEKKADESPVVTSNAGS